MPQRGMGTDTDMPMARPRPPTVGTGTGTAMFMGRTAITGTTTPRGMRTALPTNRRTTTRMTTTTLTRTVIPTVTSMAMVTATDATLLQLLWLASPALPVGAFSYSEGLETAVEEGRVIETGTQAGLLKLKGAYWKLHEKQELLAAS